MFRHWNRFRSALLLALALNLAQVGAMAHAYSHDAGQGRPADRAVIHASLCGDCSVYGVVLLAGVANSAGMVPPVPPGFASSPVDPGAAVSTDPCHHFEAQGPPAPRRLQ